MSDGTRERLVAGFECALPNDLSLDTPRKGFRLVLAALFLEVNGENFVIGIRLSRVGDENLMVVMVLQVRFDVHGLDLRHARWEFTMKLDLPGLGRGHVDSAGIFDVWVGLVVKWQLKTKPGGAVFLI